MLTEESRKVLHRLREELDAELTPGGHHRIPASAFTTRRSVERADQRLVPARR